MLSLRARPHIDTRASLGEGLQLFPDQSVFWVDIPNGQVHRIENGKTEQLHSFSHPVSKVLPWDKGYLVLGQTAILGFDKNHQQLVSVEFHAIESNLRFSDSTVLPTGDIVCGIVDMDLAPGRGSLVWIKKDWSSELVVTGATIPNGCAVNAAGKLLWVDSPTQTIRQFEISTGDLSQDDVFAKVPVAYGVPDGITVDSDGGCWVALWGGGKVIRFSPAGEIDCEVEVGTRNVTSCAFDGLGNLLITTATAALTDLEAQAQGAGGIWIVPQAEHGRSGLEPAVASLLFVKPEGLEKPIRADLKFGQHGLETQEVQR